MIGLAAGEDGGKSKIHGQLRNPNPEVDSLNEQYDLIDWSEANNYVDGVVLHANGSDNVQSGVPSVIVPVHVIVDGRCTFEVSRAVTNFDWVEEVVVVVVVKKRGKNCIIKMCLPTLIYTDSHTDVVQLHPQIR